jgi:hypothetical protein
VMHPSELGSDASKSSCVVELPPLEPELCDTDQSVEGPAVSVQDLVFDHTLVFRHACQLLTTVRELRGGPSPRPSPARRAAGES